MIYSATTDKGIKRLHNEDSFFATDGIIGPLPNLFVVADGMGGHKAGDFASRQAVLSIEKTVSLADENEDPERIIVEALKKANDDIILAAKSEPDKEGMGTTAVLCSISDRILVASIGDSRLYTFAGEELTQITRDHTVVSEMLRMGSISKAVAKRHPKRHMLTRALGVEDPVEPDIFLLDSNVEQILLATDGLYNMVPEDQIAEILSMDIAPEDKTGMLVALANENGGDDNITVLLIDILR